MTRRSREALKAYLLGDFERAGFLYEAAGEHRKALGAYLKAGNLRAAAGVEVAMGRILEAAKHLSETGDKAKAADLLSEHRQYVKAARLYAEAGNLLMASSLASRSGNPALAAEFEERAGRFFEAGVLWREAGKRDRLLACFARALERIPRRGAVNPFDTDEWQEKREFIARAFEEGGSHGRAAQLYEEMGLLDAAARCYEKAKVYGKALELYRQVNNEKKVAALAKMTEAPEGFKTGAVASGGDAARAAMAYAKSGTPQKGAALLEEAGDFSGAGKLWREAKEWERAGNAFFKAAEFMEAGECFHQAQLWNLASRAYEEAGDRVTAMRMACEGGEWERAYDMAFSPAERELLIRVWQSVPPDSAQRPLAQLMLSRAFVDLGQAKLARECLRDVPSNAAGGAPWVDYMRARVSEELDGVQEACAAYHRVLARDLFFRDARERLGHLEARLASGGRSCKKQKGGQRRS